MKKKPNQSSSSERNFRRAEKAYQHEQSDMVVVRAKQHKPLKALNPEQARYISAIQNFECVVGIGPAGTGKTYVAARYAIDALVEGKIEKIILVRPNVPLGNDIGSLPGTMLEKMLPWIAPFIDAFDDRIDRKQLEKFLELGVIEVLPVQFLRGRSVKNAVILADEIQNLNVEEMKCLVTRPAMGSKLFLSGDVKQCDLHKSKYSGLQMLVDLSAMYERKPFTIVELETNTRSGLSAFFSEAVEQWEQNDEE